MNFKNCFIFFCKLRMGKLNGFDFNKNKNEMIGVLRAFNKNHIKRKK